MSGDRATNEPPDRDAASVGLYGRNKETAGGPKTAIVFGVARGGTSMVAGAVRGLGFFMGSELPVNNEDPDFNQKPPAQMKNTIKSRNSQHRKWGWKFPAAANYLDGLLPLTINPHLIIVCRDVAATSSGHVRWHQREASFAISDILTQTQRNILLAFRWQKPTLMVSYEKACLNPEKFLDELSMFLGEPVVVDRAALIQYLQRGAYKKFEEFVAPPIQPSEPATIAKGG